ncbi:MAG: hypothetical protein CMJ75_21030 [Planctomycetaceae bacterium]|nr:hypothetical protein [Planctomycetaceae bacterium]
MLSNRRRVCRLGLATRGNTFLDRSSVEAALDAGVDYLNWCGRTDGMREAIRNLGDKRRSVVIAVQLHARTASAARRELAEIKRDLHTDYIDVVTYYYVEAFAEWSQIIAPGGAAEVLEHERAQGTIATIGLTTHQRPLAGQLAQSGRIDLLMVRYNAAHRGAEEEVFPVTRTLGISVVAFTCLRWGALLQKTPQDPRGYVPPSAAQCYRFVLANRDVDVALMAPDGDRELQDNLSILNDWHELDQLEFASLAAHGQRVRLHARHFP